MFFGFFNIQELMNQGIFKNDLMIFFFRVFFDKVKDIDVIFKDNKVFFNILDLILLIGAVRERALVIFKVELMILKILDEFFINFINSVCLIKE